MADISVALAASRAPIRKEAGIPSGPRALASKHHGSPRKRFDLDSNKPQDPKLKLVVRLLPAELTGHNFFDLVKSTVNPETCYSYYFSAGRVSRSSSKRSIYSRAYLYFKTPEHVKGFYESFSKDVVSRISSHGPILLEYAPCQTKLRSTVTDKLAGTFESDPLYKAFIEGMEVQKPQYGTTPTDEKEGAADEDFVTMISEQPGDAEPPRAKRSNREKSERDRKPKSRSEKAKKNEISGTEEKDLKEGKSKSKESKAKESKKLKESKENEESKESKEYESIISKQNPTDTSASSSNPTTSSSSTPSVSPAASSSSKKKSKRPSGSKSKPESKDTNASTESDLTHSNGSAKKPSKRKPRPPRPRNPDSDSSPKPPKSAPESSKSAISGSQNSDRNNSQG